MNSQQLIMYSNLVVRVATPSLKQFSKEAITQALSGYSGIRLEVSEEGDLDLPKLLAIEPVKPVTDALFLRATATAIDEALSQMRPAIRLI